MTTDLASMTVARNCLADELHRVEAALTKAGATQFDDSVEFIDRMASRVAAGSAVAMLVAAGELLRHAEQKLEGATPLSLERRLIASLRSEVECMGRKIEDRALELEAVR